MSYGGPLPPLPRRCDAASLSVDSEGPSPATRLEAGGPSDAEAAAGSLGHTRSGSAFRRVGRPLWVCAQKAAENIRARHAERVLLRHTPTDRNLREEYAADIADTATPSEVAEASVPRYNNRFATAAEAVAAEFQRKRVMLTREEWSTPRASPRRRLAIRPSH